MNSFFNLFYIPETKNAKGKIIITQTFDDNDKASVD